MKYKWFSYSSNNGFELHETEEMAKLGAQNWLRHLFALEPEAIHARLCVNACAGIPDKRLARKCECSLRTKCVGDGCDICNPRLALEYALENMLELTERNAALEQRVDELLEQALNMEGRAVKAEKQRGELQSKFDGLVAALTEIAWHRTPSEKCSVAVEKLEKMALAAITKAQAGEQ